MSTTEHESGENAFLQMHEVDQMEKLFAPFIKETGIVKLIISMYGKKVILHQIRLSQMVFQPIRTVSLFVSIPEQVTGTELMNVAITEFDWGDANAADLHRWIYVCGNKVGSSVKQIVKYDKFDNFELPDVIKTFKQISHGT